MKHIGKTIVASVFLASSFLWSLAARAEILTPCINQTKSSYDSRILKALDYQKVDGFLQYKSLREGWVQRHIPTSAAEEAYVQSLDEGAFYTCRNEPESGIRCVPRADACHFNKNAPEIWARVEGPIKDFGSYWIKEDAHTSCILNKRLDGILDTSVADCMTPRTDALDGITFSFYERENRAHPSLGKIWYLCSYGSCEPDYRKIYVLGD